MRPVSSIESSNEIQLTLVNPSVNVVYDIHEYWLIKNVMMKIESSLRKCSCREICGSDVAGDEKPKKNSGDDGSRFISYQQNIFG